MITPFDSCKAITSIKIISGADGKTAVCIIQDFLDRFLNNMLFKEDNVVEIDDSYEIWTYACIYDDILNNYDYSVYCSYEEEIYSDRYILVRELMKHELERKKFFSKKSVYNISEILQNIIDCLDYAIGVDCQSELMKYMESKNTQKEFESTVIDLQNNLSKHIK